MDGIHDLPSRREVVVPGFDTWARLCRTHFDERTCVMAGHRPATDEEKPDPTTVANYEVAGRSLPEPGDEVLTTYDEDTSDWTPPVAGGSGGGGGASGLIRVVCEGTDTDPDAVTPLPLTLDGDASDAFTVAAGAVTVVADGLLFCKGSFGPNGDNPIGSMVLALNANGDSFSAGAISGTLAGGESNGSIPTQFAKVAAGDVITAVLSNTDPPETPANNVFAGLYFGFAG